MTPSRRGAPRWRNSSTLSRPRIPRRSRSNVSGKRLRRPAPNVARSVKPSGENKNASEQGKLRWLSRRLRMPHMPPQSEKHGKPPSRPGAKRRSWLNRKQSGTNDMPLGRRQKRRAEKASTAGGARLRTMTSKDRLPRFSCPPRPGTSHPCKDRSRLPCAILCRL